MNVGDYVRTEYGIAKYISDKVTKYVMYYVVDKDIMACNVEGWENCLSGSNEIIKSSPNIIDLLETGDIIHYQNEYIDFISPVIVYDDGEIASNLYDSDGYIFLDKEIDENNIKSIVTKEQFERMKYKVGG